MPKCRVRLKWRRESRGIMETAGEGVSAPPIWWLAVRSSFRRGTACPSVPAYYVFARMARQHQRPQCNCSGPRTTPGSQPATAEPMMRRWGGRNNNTNTEGIDDGINKGSKGCRRSSRGFRLPVRSAHQVSEPGRFARSSFLRGARIWARERFKLLAVECPSCPRRVSSILSAAISVPISVCFAGSGEREVEINFCFERTMEMIFVSKESGRHCSTAPGPSPIVCDGPSHVSQADSEQQTALASQSNGHFLILAANIPSPTGIKMWPRNCP